MKSRKPKAPSFASNVDDMSPHKDHFHDDSGAKFYHTPEKEGLRPPEESDVAEESTVVQKDERRRRRQGTGVLDTMIRRRGGSSSTASRSGKLI